MLRSFLACDRCRHSKLKCLADINENGDPIGKCFRCTKHSFDCVFTPKPSQLKKIARLEQRAIKAKQLGTVATQHFPTTIPVKQQHQLKNLMHKKKQEKEPPTKKLKAEALDQQIEFIYDDDRPAHLQETIHNYYHTFRKACPPHQLDPIILPNRETLIHVLEAFFNNQYHTIFNFIHKESYITWIESDKFEPHFFNYDDPSDVPEFTPCTLLAILALCARHDKKLTRIYGGFNQDNEPEKFIPDFTEKTPLTQDSPSNASKYFAYYSRLLLKDVFDTPSVQRVQSLALLSSHEWTEGNSTRSYLYIGIAARMGSILGLSCKNGVCYNDEHNNYSTYREKCIALESKRRTIWSVYMMDRCNSSGRNRSHAIKMEDIEVSLPCPEQNFQNGTFVEFPSYNDCFRCLESLTSLDFTIIAYELWSKIAKWVGETGSLREQLHPKDPNSIFFKLSNDLELLKEKLPAGLKIENLNYHIQQKNLNFGYLHQLLYLCGIFLNREYFYYNSAITKFEHYQFTKNLVIELEGSLSLVTTLHSVNQFCITPFTAFQIFTNSVTCLSVASILRDSNLKSLGLQNMEFLKTYAEEDQLMSTWLTITSQLSKYLDTCTSDKFNEKLKKSSKLNNLLNDYGDSDISERLSINIPQAAKKIDLNDILNNSDSPPLDENKQFGEEKRQIITTPEGLSNGSENSFGTSERSYITTSETIKSDSSPSVDSLSNLFDTENEIDRYFKNWEKIIPNWNDVFIEDTSINAMNTYIPGNI